MTDLIDERGSDRVPGPTPRSTPRAPVAGPLESALRHPLLLLAPLVVLVALAVALGLTRDPEHEASSRISVGRVDVPAYTLQGVIIGNATLAASYARAIDAPKVIELAAREVGLSPDAARDGLSASPVPGSTLIVVEAKADSEGDAVALANAGAKSLIAYVQELDDQQQQTGLLTSYRRSRQAVDVARRRFDAIRKEDVKDTPRVQQARVELELARLRTSTIRNQIRFSDSAEGGGVSGNVLQLIAPAADASSDRSSTLQRLVLIAAAAGLALGALLALLRANRGLLRRPA